MKRRPYSFYTAVLLIPLGSFASGLPNASMQMLIKALQDSHVEVRTAAAQALIELPESAAVKPLEAALIASADAAEQDALVKALIANDKSDSAKRLSEAVANPQFNWGNGAKAHAVEVIGKVGQKKYIAWLTSLAASGDGDAAVRAAAIRVLGELGAPPKKEKKSE
jgi:HEAT repeat protein